MFWSTLGVALSLASVAEAAPANGLMARQFAQAAMMRFECSQLVYDRIDPLVQPGIAPSTHMHQVGLDPTTSPPRQANALQIVGGNSLNVSMPSVEYDPSLRSTCTTCDYAEDFSSVVALHHDTGNANILRNYWTANLYFKARNGTYKRVPQMVSNSRVRSAL
jgi:hypothetical protein